MSQSQRGTALVTRSHLVEFRAPGTCGTADAMRHAAAWLDEHPDPVVLAIYCDYDVEGDETVLTLVIQDNHDEELERLIGGERNQVAS